MFKDGYVYKTVSMKSISSQNIQPSFDELQKFQRPGDDASDDVAGLSSLLSKPRERMLYKWLMSAFPILSLAKPGKLQLQEKGFLLKETMIDIAALKPVAQKWVPVESKKWKDLCN